MLSKAHSPVLCSTQAEDSDTLDNHRSPVGKESKYNEKLGRVFPLEAYFEEKDTCNPNGKSGLKDLVKRY